MTAKQILDSFSETLMRDERILSPQERELLMSLLQNSRAVSSSDPQTQSAVTAAIARAVGETVAQRAFALLGSSIVEQILARSGMPAATEETMLAATVQSRAPQPPNPAPSPGPKAPQPPNPAPSPGPKAPQPPNALHPQHDVRTLSAPVQRVGEQSQIDSGSSVGILDSPEMVRAQCVVLDEFLAPEELEELVSYTLQREAEFQSSELVSPSGEPGMIDCDHRRSRVLMDLGKHEEVILERIRGVLPRVLDQLGAEQFRLRRLRLRSLRVMTETFSVRIAMTRKKSLRLVGSHSFTFSTANRGILRVGNCASTIRTGKVRGKSVLAVIRPLCRSRTRSCFSPARCCTKSLPWNAARGHLRTAVSHSTDGFTNNRHGVAELDCWSDGGGVAANTERDTAPRAIPLSARRIAAALDSAALDRVTVLVAEAVS